MKQDIHLIGFGSQASAWAEALRTQGLEVHVYLHDRKSPSFGRAVAKGFSSRLLADLPHALAATTTLQAVAFLCPDHKIGMIYQEVLARLDQKLLLILAHGYAVYSNELTVKNPQHELALLAPKAVGPRLLGEFQKHHPRPHGLGAGFYAQSPHARGLLLRLAKSLGFSESNLIGATFEQEAIGDLISEQGLLCGGVFTLLEWTLEKMQKAGIPERLIREECFTELELIASLIKERGPAATFKAISPAAQCGATLMREALYQSDAPSVFDSQLNTITNGEFVRQMRSPQWKDKAEIFRSKLEELERNLFKESEPQKS
ncbi:MAG: hypothetical protein AB1540_05635 [Bdellovibrionota bacterium]